MSNDFSSSFSSSFGANSPANSSGNGTKRSRRGSHKKAAVIGVVIIAVVAVGTIIFRSSPSQATKSVLPASDSRSAVEKPIASQTMNKEFKFPLRDQTGKVVSNITYEIQTAELRNQIVVKGAKANAVTGRTFLIISMKITNDYNKSIQLNARDYLRLIVDDSPEKLAPDIHNDPVEVQAISTKYTRVGFPIDDKKQKLILQIGEVTGKKEMVDLNL